MAAQPRVTDTRKIGLNLDTVKNEIPSEAGPFTFVIKTKPITLISPDQADWRSLNSANPAEILKGLMSEADWKFFYEQEVKMYQIQALMAAWYEHHGVAAKNL